MDTYDWETVKDDVYTALDNYFASLAEAWEEGAVTVRINHVNNALMNVKGIEDVSATTLNGSTSNILIDSKNIPIRGTVNGNS